VYSLQDLQQLDSINSSLTTVPNHLTYKETQLRI